MAEEGRESLLIKKVYYDNCPGCLVEQRNELQRGLPIKMLVAVWLVVLAAGMSFFDFVFCNIILDTESEKGFHIHPHCVVFHYIVNLHDHVACICMNSSKHCLQLILLLRTKN